jgi:hypothetical protein
MTDEEERALSDWEPTAHLRWVTHGDGHDDDPLYRELEQVWIRTVYRGDEAVHEREWRQVY